MKKYTLPGFKFVYLSLILIALSISSCKTDSNNQNKDESSNSNKDGFVKIFDGTLKNWEGDPDYWSVENGNLVGEVTPSTLLKNNTFIIWQGGKPANFELKAEFRITENGNSGINYRSIALDSIPFALRGYQADIDGKNNYTGQNYEERGRTTLAYRGEKVRIDALENPSGSLRDNVKNNAWTERTVIGLLGEPDSLKTLINSEDWNKIHLIVDGNRMQHYINGVLMSEVTDNDTINRKLSGKIGVQVHVGPPMKVEYRNLRLKKL